MIDIDRDLGLRELVAVFLGLLTAAVLIHLLPQWGAHIMSDVQWIYRLQGVDDPRIAAAVPFGLKAAGGDPSGFAGVCGALYEAFGRWNCLDHVAFRAIAELAGGNANGWLFIYVVNNSLNLVLFYAILRTIRVGTPLSIFLLAGLLLAPLEAWQSYRISEPRATFLLLAAVLVALRARGAARHWLSALLMALAVLMKEPFGVYWPAVLAAGIAADPAWLQRGREGSGWISRLIRRLGHAVLPHIAGLGLVAAFRLLLRFIYENPYSYAYYTLGVFPDLDTFTRSVLYGFMPALLQNEEIVPGTLWLVGGCLTAVAAVCLAISRPARGRLGVALSRPGFWLLLVGVAAPVAAHAALYFVTGRVVGGRYAVPANYFLALTLAVASLPLASALSTWQRHALLATASAAALAMAASTLERNAVPLTIGVALAALAVIACAALWLMSRAEDGRTRIWPAAASLGLCVILAAPVVDYALDQAGSWRRDMASWAEMIEQVDRQAPPGGHVVLAFENVGMIETAWGLEAETLLRGRSDLTYHLDLVDTRQLEEDAGLLRSLVEAYNRDRPEAPVGEGKTLTVAANRAGHAANDRPELSSGAWLALLVRSPAAFYRERYLAGKAGFLSFSLALDTP